MAEKMSFTPEQLSAIEDRGGALLVSAAAGSGKTRVLVERLIRRVAEPGADCSVDDFLIITYTKAAASELRGRIRDSLNMLVAADPENRRLSRQASYCARAPIGTIHSFCVGLIRENAHKLGISPDFRVMDETESAAMKERILSDLLDEKYEHIDTDTTFRMLADTMSAGRDDRKMVDIILDTHTKLLSHPYPEKWMAAKAREYMLDGVTDVSQTVWGAVLIKSALRRARYWTARLEATLGDAEFAEAYGESVNESCESARRFITALETGWDAAVMASDIVFPRGRPLKGCDAAKDERNRCKRELQKAAAPFVRESRVLLGEMKQPSESVLGLFELVLEFSAAYDDEKRRKAVIDFSDQEHLAVQLLVDEKTGEPTETARAVSRRYVEIMVDEYQDVNAVQELIFGAVSRAGRNVFMVGDIRQSIYRFRLADPMIFLGKYLSFSDAVNAVEGEPRKIVLAKNFRSRRGIIDAVNFVFSNVMSTEFGEMEYGEDEMLRCGAEYPESDEPCVEIDVLDLGGDADETDRSGRMRAEADFVAERIAELLRSEMTMGRDGTRRIAPGDIAILLRSMKGKADRYAAALTRLGIPVSYGADGGFFDTPEVSAMVSLLAVIDNPRQDVPLISAMRSPVWGFTADELADIRLTDKHADFWTALGLSAAGGNEKSALFVSDIAGFRAAAPDISSDELIWHIYTATGMLGVVSAMPEGERRRNNLMRLFEYAASFEKNGYKGLFEFNIHLREIIERGAEGAAAAAASEDAVTIMSIHKSKGLEFPVVILADTAKLINFQDSSKPMIIHQDLGAGPKYVDTRRKTECPTVARMAISKKTKDETMAEELRVLYVAMTRAMEKLIIVATYKDAPKVMERLSKEAECPVPPAVLESTRSMAEWILLPALTRPDCASLLGRDSQQNGEWEARIIDLCTPEDAEEKAEKTHVQTREADEAEVCRIEDMLGYKYPYESSSQLPSKLTATELKGPGADRDEDAGMLIKIPVSLRMPDFTSGERALTAAERGVAMHAVMQYIDFTKPHSADSVLTEVARLTEAGFITQKQAAAVDAVKISRLLNSDVGREIYGAEKVYREFKFSLLVPSEELIDGGGGDEILLQGVVDCFAEYDDGLVIIDYKTDRVTTAQVPLRAESYRGQVGAYAIALGRITGKKVKAAYVYFFSAGETVKIL